MKKLIGFVLVFVLLSCGFVSASVTVHNLTLKQQYAPYDFLSGDINLTINDERLDGVVSSNLGGDVMTLGDWLDGGGDCVPSDCSVGYDSSGSAVDSLELDVGVGKEFFEF